MRPPRRSLVAPVVAATAAFGLLVLPVAVPVTAAATTPPLAVGACDVEGALEQQLGERFGGVWADAPSQHFRVGIVDRAAESIARSVVEACDAEDAYHGVPTSLLRAPNTAYVVVRSPYPAVKRAQQTLAAWQSSPAGQALGARIVSHGIGLESGDANVDGHVGMVLRVTLHLSTTDAEADAIQTAITEIAAAHHVTIEIAAERSDYPSALIGQPGPIASPIVAPSPSGAERSAAPTILGRATASRRTTLRTRRLPVRLRVAEAGAFRVTVRAADRRRTVIARGVATSKRAGRLTVRTTLSRAGRTQLRAARRTTVTVSVRPPSGATVAKRVVVR